ncbi:MAG: sortase [Candidatus Paceibacterota bacterium]|jgi:LPXTG-site transpeptidase (sortase) family protein
MFSRILKSIKPYWKFILVFYLIALFAWNWSRIAWVLNSNFIGIAAQSVWTKAGQTFGPERFSEGESKTDQVSTSTQKQEDKNFVEKKDSLVIGKISVDAPLVQSPSGSDKDINSSLEKGVLIFPSSVLPSEKGVTIILGHTAPSGWLKVNFYGLFNHIDKLQKGDEILVYFDNHEYKYTVTRQFLVDPGAKLEPSSEALTNSENVLFLSTCWPPETGVKRIIIEASR